MHNKIVLVRTFIFYASSGIYNISPSRRCDQPRSFEKYRKEFILTNPTMSRYPYPGGPMSNLRSEAPGTTSGAYQFRHGCGPRKDGFRLNASEGPSKAP